jgi:riboflavin kinase
MPFAGSTSQLKTVNLKGTVFSGKGEGEEFVRLAWVEKQIEDKLEFTAYPGTLNIRLDTESTQLRKAFQNANAIRIHSVEGFSSGRCFKANLHDTKCALVIPEVANYPEDVIEIIARVNLRERLQIKDGDRIEVKIKL